MASAFRRWSWLLLLAPLLILTAVLVASFLWNEDFWWYLASGRAIVAQGGIPAHDPFLYTTAASAQQWVLHSWLWTVIVAALDSLGGLGLVVAWHTVLALAVLGLVYTARRVDRWGLANVVLAAIFVAVSGWRLCGKAELATYLFVALDYRLF